jgi:hypothetical protein
MAVPDLHSDTAMTLPVRTLAVLAVLGGLSAAAARPARAQSAPPAVPPPATPAAQSDEDDRQVQLAQPDYALVALPTTLRLPLRGASFRLTHRFLANLRQGSFGQHLGNVFGLDNGAVIGLEFRYAPVRSLQVIVHRSSLDKTLQFSAQYDALRQGASLPVSISGLLSIEGTNNFRARPIEEDHDHGVGGGGAHRSPAIGAVVSRTFGDRLAVYAVPVWVRHSAIVLEGHRDTGFVGVGGRARLASKVYVVAEVSPRVGGFAPGSPAFSFGIERRAGGHMFLLTFGNSLATTFGQISQGGFPDTVYMGFNLSRKFF